MGRKLIIKGADFSQVAVAHSYATETEERIDKSIIYSNAKILLNQSGGIGTDGSENSTEGSIRSTFIPIDELKDIVFYGDNTLNLGHLYDENKQSIGVVLTGIEWAILGYVSFGSVIENNPNAKYVRLNSIAGNCLLVRTDGTSAMDAYNAMTNKMMNNVIDTGDITVLASNISEILSGTYVYSKNQMATLLYSLDNLRGKTIINNGIYSNSIQPIMLFKENMQIVNNYNVPEISANVPLSLNVDEAMETYANAKYIAICVDVRADNPTIKIN